MIASPHRTIPNDVLISEPVTVANRGEIARWLEDHGHSVGLPADGAHQAMVVQSRRQPERVATYGERFVISGADLDVIDHAHYKLWYEPVEIEPEPEPDDE